MLDGWTGRILTDDYEQAILDAKSRVLYPRGRRPLFPNYGSEWWYIAADGGSYDEVVGTISRSLQQSTHYTLISVDIDTLADIARVDVYLRFPDGVVVRIQGSAFSNDFDISFR